MTQPDIEKLLAYTYSLDSHTAAIVRELVKGLAVISKVYDGDSEGANETGLAYLRDAAALIPATDVVSLVNGE
jgi:hypothetical protein